MSGSHPCNTGLLRTLRRNSGRLGSRSNVLGVATTQMDFSADELLESDPIAEPLIAGGVRGQGGFDGSGAYVSPRTKTRGPAIRAWQQQRQDQFGTALLDIA